MLTRFFSFIVRSIHFLIKSALFFSVMFAFPVILISILYYTVIWRVLPEYQWDFAGMVLWSVVLIGISWKVFGSLAKKWLYSLAGIMLVLTAIGSACRFYYEEWFGAWDIGFNRLYEIPTTSLELDTFNEKIPEITRPEQCAKLDAQIRMLDAGKKHPMLFKSHTKHSFTEHAWEVSFPILSLAYTIIETHEEIERIERQRITMDPSLRELDISTPDTYTTLVADIQPENLEKYMSLQATLQELYAQLHALQWTDYSAEMQAVFSPEYRENMRIFTEILREELANGRPYILCPENDVADHYDSIFRSYEVMSIVNNDILLKAFYKQYDAIDTSLLESLVNNQKQRMFPLSLSISAEDQAWWFTYLVWVRMVEDKILNTLQQSLEIGVPPEKFSSLKQALLVHNRKDDLILALKQDYWFTQKLIKKTTEQYSEKYREWPLYNQKELDMLLAHAYTEHLRSVDTSRQYPETVFSDGSWWFMTRHDNLRKEYHYDAIEAAYEVFGKHYLSRDFFNPLVLSWIPELMSVIFLELKKQFILSKIP